MRRPARRPGCPREHDAQDVRVLVPVEERAEVEELGRSPRREPRPRVGLARLELVQPGASIAQLALEDEEVVAARLHTHEQDVEGGDVDPCRVEPALERLDERRARAGEGIEHAAAAREIAARQHFGELRDELPEVRVQAVHVLRPLALREVALRPRELEVDVGVESVLRRGHRHGRVLRRGRDS